MANTQDTIQVDGLPRTEPPVAAASRRRMTFRERRGRRTELAEFLGALEPAMIFLSEHEKRVAPFAKRFYAFGLTLRMNGSF